MLWSTLITACSHYSTYTILDWIWISITHHIHIVVLRACTLLVLCTCLCYPQLGHSHSPKTHYIHLYTSILRPTGVSSLYRVYRLIYTVLSYCLSPHHQLCIDMGASHIRNSLSKLMPLYRFLVRAVLNYAIYLKECDKNICRQSYICKSDSWLYSDMTIGSAATQKAHWSFQSSMHTQSLFSAYLAIHVETNNLEICMHTPPQHPKSLLMLASCSQSCSKLCTPNQYSLICGFKVTTCVYSSL